VISLEYLRTNTFVERQFDLLYRFRHAKSFQEFDNEIPLLEGGIPILDQYVESPSEALSPPYEAPTTFDQ